MLRASSVENANKKEMDDDDKTKIMLGLSRPVARQFQIQTSGPQNPITKPSSKPQSLYQFV
uniref:CSON006355 protein n=1 Tax=Culicoides sonorensis TaxID=179676 RepID=A0A336LW81_CULSO